MQKLYIIILIISISCRSNAAVIKGKIIDSRTGDSLIGVLVRMPQAKLGASTDINGKYVLNNVPVGKHIINFLYIGYYTHIDTINIKSQDDTVTLSISLKPLITDLDSVSSPSNEAYHKKLEEFNKIKSVLSVTIDSLSYSNYFLTAFLSIKNNSYLSVYVLKNYPCFNVIFPLITDSTGKLIKRNRTMVDCMGEKTCADTTDLINIAPGNTIKYPPVKLMFFGFDEIKNGKYVVKIKYEFDKPKTINLFYCRSENNIKALISALRGSYISQNSKTFVNEYSKR